MTNNDNNLTTDKINNYILQNIPKPNRIMAPVGWYGGKGRMAKRIIPYIPYGTPYVEPYCGAASIFWHLNPPRKIEVLNDINNEIINLFRVLQNKDLFEKLLHKLTWTLYSFDEFKKALDINFDNSDSVTAAWACFVRQNQGFAGKAKTVGDWGKVITSSSRGMASEASTWRTHLSMLKTWHNRLSRVQLDSRDALDVIKYWDTENTVFYLDPPYMQSTLRDTDKNPYDYQTNDLHHENLIDLLLNIKGQCVLSGYNNPLYKKLIDNNWKKIVFKTQTNVTNSRQVQQHMDKSDNLSSRVEILWIKYNSSENKLKKLKDMKFKKG